MNITEFEHKSQASFSFINLGRKKWSIASDKMNPILHFSRISPIATIRDLTFANELSKFYMDTSIILTLRFHGGSYLSKRIILSK